MPKPYLYDLHVHTQESSRCGRVPAAEMVGMYSEAGYSGLVITDHLNVSLEEMVGESGRTYSWSTIAERFLRGYRLAREEGARRGMQVLLGAEIRFSENDCDYLIYGFSEEDLFLPSFEYVYRLDIQTFSRRFPHLLTIQAHPFRENAGPVPVECLDGLEVWNANMRHDNNNERALELAERYALLQTAGSDAHRPEDVARCAMAFRSCPASPAQLIREIRKGNYSIIKCEPGNGARRAMGASPQASSKASFAQRKSSPRLKSQPPIRK